MSYNDWKIVLAPVGENDNEQNQCAMAVKLTNGSHTQEVATIAFIRRNSKNPKVTFEQQLAEVVGTARSATKALNEQLKSDGGLL